MTVLFFRTVVVYVLLSTVLRIMGKRQVGELEVSELVSTLLLSELAALPIENPEIPFLFGLIPILFIFSTEIAVTYLKNKYEPIKRLFESKPVYLIVRGELSQKALLEMRISINELLGECRLQGVSDLSDIDYAILEQNGNLSLLLKDGKQPLTPDTARGESSPTMHPVILDGKLDLELLPTLGIGEDRIEQICRKNRCALSDVFLLTVADDGSYHLIKKDRAKRGKEKKKGRGRA